MNNSDTIIIEINDQPVEVTYVFYPEEPETREYPGMGAYASVEDIQMIHSSGSKIDVNKLLGDTFDEYIVEKIVEVPVEVEKIVKKETPKNSIIAEAIKHARRAKRN